VRANGTPQASGVISQLLSLVSGANTGACKLGAPVLLALPATLLGESMPLTSPAVKIPLVRRPTPESADPEGDLVGLAIRLRELHQSALPTVPAPRMHKPQPVALSLIVKKDGPFLEGVVAFAADSIWRADGAAFKQVFVVLREVKRRHVLPSLLDRLRQLTAPGSRSCCYRRKFGVAEGGAEV
jgi:hypothetical protein